MQHVMQGSDAMWHMVKTGTRGDIAVSSVMVRTILELGARPFCEASTIQADAERRLCSSRVGFPDPILSTLRLGCSTRNLY